LLKPFGIKVAAVAQSGAKAGKASPPAITNRRETELPIMLVIFHILLLPCAVAVYRDLCAFALGGPRRRP
jgi:hypothetical protein